MRENIFVLSQTSGYKPFFGVKAIARAPGRAGGLLTNNGVCSVYVLIPGSEHWNHTLFSSRQMPLKRRLMH